MLKELLLTMRIKQWTKNLIIFFGLIFSLNLSKPSLLLTTVAAFIIFCGLSSAVYITNDLADLEQDRAHPLKRHRPLASGRLSPRTAATTALILILLTLSSAFVLDLWFGLIAAIYLGLMLGYSFVLKHLVLVDVLAIAVGFVLRAAAGAVVIHVPISPWLYVCTVLGALFLGFSKRRHELILLNNAAVNHRPILQEYSPQLLDQIITIVTASTLMAYSLYTFSAENLPKDNSMMLTIPFVLYGAFRYLYLVHIKNAGGSPEEMLLKDKPLLIDVALWLISVIVILYIVR
ncbi:MAG: decaprenyl-phosphate phosphoribosyltransferase [Chloroflexi bacterium]|nr:decaprenyl-phosphate phosphoribosyltransferase [Chloroflexota bacterium]MCL5076445.1 decaprenyl-phosphate phosphoribosyltransferase [Chloroflexota bacterium]